MSCTLASTVDNKVVGLPRAFVRREGAREVERAEAVQVTTCVEDGGGASQISAGRQLDEAGIERMQDYRRLMLGGKHRVGFIGLAIPAASSISACSGKRPYLKSHPVRPGLGPQLLEPEYRFIIVASVK